MMRRCNTNLSAQNLWKSCRRAIRHEDFTVVFTNFTVHLKLFFLAQWGISQTPEKNLSACPTCPHINSLPPQTPLRRGDVSRDAVNTRRWKYPARFLRHRTPDFHSEIVLSDQLPFLFTFNSFVLSEIETYVGCIELKISRVYV